MADSVGVVMQAIDLVMEKGIKGLEDPHSAQSALRACEACSLQEGLGESPLPFPGKV